VDYSRRHLLRIGQVVLAAAVLPETSFGAGWSESGFAMTQKRFASLVNASFHVQTGPSGSRWFTLLSVEDMTPKMPAFVPARSGPRHAVSPKPQRSETFAITFQGAGDALPQDTYVFENDTTGHIPLFIVPAPDGTYVAIVNRIVE
jgi:hypothetical protein